MLYRQYAEIFLKRVREFVTSENLDLNRLPKWMQFSNVHIAKLNNSIIFLFEDSTHEKDTFHEYGNVNSDLQFFLTSLLIDQKLQVLKLPITMRLV